VIQHLECLVSRENVPGDGLFLQRQQGHHPLHHVLLLGLHVELEVGAQSGLQIAAHSVLKMTVQLGLEDIDHERVRVEGVVELVDEDRQPTDLLA